MQVGIINYGMGNVKSVLNAVKILGFNGMLINAPSEISKCGKIILPGVGAFQEGMRKLNSAGWTVEIQRAVREKGMSLLGICLGMQLLAETGTEHGLCSGLGLVGGCVEKLDVAGLPLPHIGWNTVRFSLNNRLYLGLGQEQDYYFVHSYVLVPVDQSIVSGICNYQKNFVASIEQNNIFGTQYHPEKSQKAGLTVLKNFLTC